MNDKCECGHAKDDHANHYDYHQCFILGCGCQEYTAAQQSVQPTDGELAQADSESKPVTISG